MERVFVLVGAAGLADGLGEQPDVLPACSAPHLKKPMPSPTTSQRSGTNFLPSAITRSPIRVELDLLAGIGEPAVEQQRAGRGRGDEADAGSRGKSTSASMTSVLSAVSVSRARQSERMEPFWYSGFSTKVIRMSPRRVPAAART